MALETVLRQDRPHVPVKVDRWRHGLDRLRSLLRRSRQERDRNQGGKQERQEKGASHNSPSKTLNHRDTETQRLHREKHSRREKVTKTMAGKRHLEHIKRKVPF